MQNITLRFSGSSNIAALAVKIYTWSWCSHVETVIDDSFWGRRLYGALPDTGVNFRPIDSTKNDRVEEYEVSLSAFKKNIYIEKLLSQKGKPYDYTAILGLVTHRNWGTDNKSEGWFCSELVAWAFNEAGHPLVRTEHRNLISPENLLLSPLLKRIS